MYQRQIGEGLLRRPKALKHKSLERRFYTMKFWWSALRLPEGLVEAVDNEREVKRNGFMGAAADSARGMFLLSLSMILLLFNLLDGDSSSRP